MPEGVVVTRRDDAAMRFRVVNPQVANPHLLQALVAVKAPMIAFQEVPQTLETVYLRAMQGARTSGAAESHD